MNTTNKTDKRVKNSNFKKFCRHIKSLRETSGKSIACVSKMLDIHRNSQANYELDRDPNIDYLLAFSEVVDTSFWRLIGERIKLSNNPKRLIDKALMELGPIYSELKQQSGSYLVDRIPQPDSQALQEAVTLPAVLQDLIDKFKHHSGIELYQQTGQSMTPKICDGDWVVVDTQDKKVIDGQIYFVKLGNNYVARRLQYTSTGNIMITSDNRKFLPLPLDKNHKQQFEIVGKMACYISHCH